MALYYSYIMCFMLQLLLTIVNFCESVYTYTRTAIEGRVNYHLKGCVLYYSLYSKEEQYYATLYDYTGFWRKVWLVICSMIYQDYFNKNNIFKYDAVHENMEHLAHFLIDCAVITYIDDDAKTKHRILTHTGSEITSTASNCSYIYALVVDVEGKEHNFTTVFNAYKEDVFTSDRLTVSDFITIFAHRLGLTLSCVDLCSLKTMMDNDFEERVLKGKDQLMCKIIS